MLKLVILVFGAIIFFSFLPVIINWILPKIINIFRKKNKTDRGITG